MSQSNEQWITACAKRGSKWLAKQGDQWRVAASSKRLLKSRMRYEGPYEVWLITADGPALIEWGTRD